MRLALASFLLLALTACGGSGEPNPVPPEGRGTPSSPAEPTPTEPSDLPETIPPVETNAQSARWEKRAKGEKGRYAVEQARTHGWKGSHKAGVESMLVTCDAFADYKAGESAPEAAWTLVLSQVRFGQNDAKFAGEAVIEAVGNFVGGACPELTGASKDSLTKILVDGGFE